MKKEDRMKALMDKGQFTQSGMGNSYMNDASEEEMEQCPHCGQDMNNDLVSAMKSQEEMESPEDEASESPEYQAMEDKLGIEKHRLFKKPALAIEISMGKKK